MLWQTRVTGGGLTLNVRDIEIYISIYIKSETN